MNMNLSFRRSFEQSYEDFVNPIGGIFVIAHRGIWFDAPENSLPAIRASMELGVDMVEIDVQKTADGHLILMHDETVDRMTNGKGEIADITYNEFKQLKLKQSQGEIPSPLTNESIPTLEEAMLLVKDKIFVNLDKCWDYREEVYKVLVKTGTVKQALFKSTAELDEVEAFLQSKSERPEYMHVIQESNEQLLLKPNELFERIRPRAIELIFENEECLMTRQEVLDYFKGKCRIWINTMWGDLCAGHSDQRSFVTPMDGWGWGISKGANMIQTDYSEKLIQYLKETKL